VIASLAFFGRFFLFFPVDSSCFWEFITFALKGVEFTYHCSCAQADTVITRYDRFDVNIYSSCQKDPGNITVEYKQKYINAVSVQIG